MNRNIKRFICTVDENLIQVIKLLPSLEAANWPILSIYFPLGFYSPIFQPAQQVIDNVQLADLSTETSHEDRVTQLIEPHCAK